MEAKHTHNKDHCNWLDRQQIQKTVALAAVKQSGSPMHQDTTHTKNAKNPSGKASRLSREATIDEYQLRGCHLHQVLYRPLALRI